MRRKSSWKALYSIEWLNPKCLEETRVRVRERDLLLRSGAIEGGDSGVEQGDVNRLAQISELLGGHGMSDKTLDWDQQQKP